MTYEELAEQLADINKKMVQLPLYAKMTDANRGETVLLSYLARHNGAATPVELSEAVGVSTARIAALLNRLEKRQWIARQKHPENNRNVVVQLQDAGRRHYENRAALFSQNAVRFFQTLGPEKAALFVELQRDMADFMAQQSDREDA